MREHVRSVGEPHVSTWEPIPDLPFGRLVAAEGINLRVPLDPASVVFFRRWQLPLGPCDDDPCQEPERGAWLS